MILPISKIADYERGKKNKKYPHGTTLVQISATKGQVHFYDESFDEEISSKYVCFYPKDKEIDPYYLFIIIKREMPGFSKAYQTGINIQVDAFKHLKVYFHEDVEEREKLVSQMKRLEKIEKNLEKSLSKLEDIKKEHLHSMFV